MTYQEMKVTIPGNSCTQFGKSILISQIQFSTLEAIFEVDEAVQRKLDLNRRTEIREFIIDSVSEGDFYFSPFIFSSRGAIKEENDGGELPPGSKIYILDGQHRTYALISAISHLRARKEAEEEIGNFKQAEKLQKQIDKLKTYPVTIQIYLNLETHEERQLFNDINTKRKEPHIGLVMKYDQRDEYAELTRDIARILESEMEIEATLSRITVNCTALTSLTIMRRCLIALFEGNVSVKTGKANYGDVTKDEIISIATAFFESWLEIFPKKMADRKTFTSGYSGIQIALAKTIHQLHKHHEIPYEEAIDHMLPLKEACTWKHEDPLFSHIYDPFKKRVKNHSTTYAIQKTALVFKRKIEQEGGWLHDSR
ncbi:MULTISPECIES: DGQHR domain-containing protein [unclassified Peribacillus]|uniref:DGQHR domain-containing protein n=1 Tax=unclassified Peribacillus TaxID=2675266 RepID=UPI00366E8DD0